MNKINFKQPKYMIPAIVYIPLLFVGYMVIDMFNVDTSDPGNPKLKTTDYLSGELPEAYTDSVLGSKMSNTEREYGKIRDLSGVKNVENDNDSIKKKEEYESKYSDEEAQQVRKQQAEEKKKLEEMQNRVRQGRKSSSDDNDFVAPVSDSDIAKVQRMRRQNKWDDMERNLSGDSSDTGNNTDISGSGSVRQGSSANGNEAQGNYGSSQYGGYTQGNTHGSATSDQRGDEEQPEKVVKKTKEVSDYFNTLGHDNGQSKLITAIIDENVKAVDGSRVRLRLLDDIEIGDRTVKKGTYLYATMSGFGKQRVNGKIESIFCDEEITKVDLTLYDTDGLPGLYVPLSSFRETAKDVASSAMQGGNIMDNNTTSGGGVKGWASQAAQNASQRVMNALGTAAKKNRVRLKYGTRVYLVDSSKNK